MTNLRRIFTLLTACVGNILPTAHANDGTTQYHLNFSGDDTLFKAECTLTRPGGIKRRIIQANAPFEITFVGIGLQCDIQAKGPLELEITGSNGTHTRTRTEGGMISISFS